MIVNPQITSFFPKLKLKRSESGKKVLLYEKSKSANSFFDFVSFHPSIRAAFNSMVKAEFISLERGSKHLRKLLEHSKTSLVYEAKCDCGQLIERPHIYDLLKTNFPKSMTCIKCGRVKNLTFEDHKPFYEIESKNLLKALFVGNKTAFTISPMVECFECNVQVVKNEPEELNLICDKCGKPTYISMQVFPYAELDDLLKDRHGYWLEWFVWRLLKEKHTLEVGVKVGNKYESDLIIIHNGKKIFVECKDASDSPLLNLHNIKKDFDYYLLISTSIYKKAHLDGARELLNEKFHYVTPDKIENISGIIDKLK